MKFIALAALVVSTVSAAGTVLDYKVCTKTADCKTTTSQCCQATKAGEAKTGDFICGPKSPTTVPNGVAFYAGFAVDCTKSPAVEAAGSLVASVVTLVSAAYLLA